ncbi:MAG: Cna B-type domain-containing protein, partial [Clostridia bacterium]|nr:Cna B-type domain-containing protein [Clostridia bacterium]
NRWESKIENLPKYADGEKIEYTWVEGDMPEGYTLTDTKVEGTITTLTNTYETEKTEATVKKVWKDAENQDGKRPESLTVVLSNGTEVVLNAENQWTATVEDLPKYADGEEIVYTWKEGDMPAGYELTDTSVEGTVTTLTNTYTARTTVKFSATKQLIGAKLVDGQFSFELKDEAGNLLQTKTNTENGVVTFDAIPLEETGTYTFTLQESIGAATDARYRYDYDKTSFSIVVNVTKNAEGQLEVDESYFVGTLMVDDVEFTNTATERVGAIGVKKVDSLDESKGLVGAVFAVYSDYSCRTWVGNIITNETGDGILEGLPVGTYYVKETKAPNNYLGKDQVYTVEVTEGETVMLNGGVVTNDRLARLELEKSDRLDPAKKIPGAEYTFYTDKDCLEVLVLPNGDKAVITTGENGLGALDGVVPGTYWYKETKAPEGYEIDPEVYELTVDEDVTAGGNVRVDVSDYPLRGVLTLKKTVIGAAGTDETFTFEINLSIASGDKLNGSYDATLNGEATEPVLFVLTATGAKATVTLKDGDVLTISGLRDGTAYTVTEQTNVNYDVTVNGAATATASGAISENAASTVDYKNTRKSVDFTVDKVWIGKEGGEIELVLYANGEILKPQPEVKREGNTYTYTDLPALDAEGKAITYSVRETTMVGYDTTYENAAPNADRTDCAFDGGKIINRELTSFAVRKVWNGLTEGETAPEIELTLYCNDTAMDVKTPAPDADGWYVYNNLPNVVDGKEAVYYVKETPVDGFITTYVNSGENESETECAYNGGTIENAKIPQTGDAANPMLWMAMSLLAAVGLLGVAMLNRKRMCW